MTETFRGISKGCKDTLKHSGGYPKNIASCPENAAEEPAGTNMMYLPVPFFYCHNYENPPPLGGINSGMPNVPELLSFMVARSPVDFSSDYYESLAAVRRHKFRYAQCAWITFIHGGTLTRGRMKV